MSTLALDGTLPRSRRGDPTTSVDAGRAVDLNASQAYVLALFGRHYGLSHIADHELVAIAFAQGSRYTPQRIRSARAELTQLGRIVLVEGEKRTTPHGGRAKVWRLA